MKPRVLFIAALVALFGIAWLALRPEQKSPGNPSGPLPPPVVSAPPVPGEIPPPPLAAPAAPAPAVVPAATAAARRDLANPLSPASFPEAPPPRPAEADPDAAADLDKIVLMLRDYRTLAGENPVGTNAEIMKSIMGANPKGATLGPPEGQSVNGGGELLDRWGTPYFFHQLSKDLMEIHSAGPDRRMWTEDDLVTK